MTKINNPFEHADEDKHLYAVSGHVKVDAHDEEEAKIMVEEDIKELLYQAFLNGNLTIGEIK